LEYNATYLRISKHGILAHRQIAVAQEKALLRFHAGWSNFADWINDTIKGGNKMTYRQSQRLFIKNFARRLLVSHHKQNTSFCPAHLSTQLLAKSVREVIGCDGGSMANAMKHGCMDCTHRKWYRADLINEGAILDNAVDCIAVDGIGNEEAGVLVSLPVMFCTMLKIITEYTTN
jgi:hypothetical protein